MTNYHSLSVHAFTVYLPLTEDTKIADLLNLKMVFASDEDLEAIDALSFMRGDFNYYETELQAVEAFGQDNGLTSNEADLSTMFDNSLINQPNDVLLAIVQNDSEATHKAFSRWAETKALMGYLHPVQVKEYAYIGKYA